MGFRFRYLGPEGGEVDVESLDGLRALMESGTVGELTLLYDVLTGEWAPARAHAAFRLLREEKGHEGDSCQTSGSPFRSRRLIASRTPSVRSAPS